MRDRGASCLLFFGADKGVSKGFKNCQKSKICHFHLESCFRIGCEIGVRVALYFLLLTEAVSKGCENCKKSRICHFYLNHDLRMGCEIGVRVAFYFWC